MRKTLSIILFIFCTALPILVPLIVLAEDDVATALYKEGLKKYILTDYEGALKDFDSAYQLKPGDVKIKKMYITTLIKQGNFYYEKNNLNKALEYYLRAQKLGGEDEILKNNLKEVQEKIAQEKSAQGQVAMQPTREQAAMQPGQKPSAEEQRTETAQTEAVAGGKTETTTVVLPFDIDAFIQQQVELNKKALNEILEAQRKEREKLVKNIEEGQKLLGENIKAQEEERKNLYSSLENNQKLFNQNITTQKEERQSLYKNIEENQRFINSNQRLLDENMKAQQQERQNLLEHITSLTSSQNEERKIYTRSLMIIVGGAIVITFLIFIGIILVLRRRTVPIQSVYHETGPGLDYKPSVLLEYGEKIDDTKYITDDRYSDIVRAKRLQELYGELQKGNLSWDVLEGYISELNLELKSEIINTVKKKLEGGEKADVSSAIEVLLPFITEGESKISSKSRSMIKQLTVEPGKLEEEEEEEGPLSLGALKSMAEMVDAKTGRINHSTRVSEIAYKLAKKLNNPELDPVTVRKVGLIHDIGYLKTADEMMKKRGKLTEDEFEIIKTHPECGLHLTEHLPLTPDFINGIKYHHERLDGSGYPEGLKGDKIPLIARVLAVADFFESVTSVRPHRPSLTTGSALKMTKDLSGKIFDDSIVSILLEMYKSEAEGEV